MQKKPKEKKKGRKTKSQASENEQKQEQSSPKEEEVVYHRYNLLVLSSFASPCRYYHLFKQGELDELILRNPNTRVLQSIWDHDNWYLVAEKTSG